MRRALGNLGDIYWAFSGILDSMKEQFPSGYIWALPQEFLDGALLWTQDHLHPAKKLHRFPWKTKAAQIRSLKFHLGHGFRLPVMSTTKWAVGTSSNLRLHGIGYYGMTMVHD